MKKGAMKYYILPVLAALLLLPMACQPDDFTEPSFLHVDAINLVPPSQNAITLEPGFYTSDIVAAYAVAHYPGEQTLDTLGLFMLPFTIPVLHNGPVDYIEIFPAVPQSGQAYMLPFYTFYKKISIRDTVLHSGDTLNLGTLTTTYNLTMSDVLMYEMFEPTEMSLLFDSVMQWRPMAPDEACSGWGYGYVPVADSLYTVDFSIDRQFLVTDPGKLVYLELDSRCDMELAVFMESAIVAGGNTTRAEVMRIRPSDEWKHLYINMGRTWSYFNHNPQFRISFTAINDNQESGEIRLDNVRLLTTSTVL